MRKTFTVLLDDIRRWSFGWYVYGEKKLTRIGKRFEAQKDFLVDILIARRGTYQRPFMHFSLAILLVVGIMTAPAITNSYKGISAEMLADFTPPSAVVTSFDLAEYGVQTKESEKPRDKVISHTVKDGETLSSLSKQYGVSVDTIKWANNLQGDSLSIGKVLTIPPVTGIVHKVKEGETVYTIAKKYKSDAQKIVNFPFNEFTDQDTFALAEGQSLIIPDGVIEEAPAIAYRAPIIPLQGTAGGTGQFLWPTNGVITTYPVWYHMAVDIANPSAPPIVATDTGIVVLVQYLRYGYGSHIMIDHGNGYVSLYAHMSEIYVNVGSKVSRGQTIGRMGSTGRSTGTHLHFEIRKNGTLVNPLPFLK
ncbi:M23 family metallopeptidase [Candidatus Gottesmanbacteria bacterium]|nr:M23 family metallopeptidase [Candidatus Gottesmanbacteria bacterium]